MASPLKRRFQFSMWTLFVVVTVAAALAGAVRWLIILTGGRVATAVVVAVSLVAIWARLGSWGRRLWLRWERRREAGEQTRAREAGRKLLELPEVKEAISAAGNTDSKNSIRPPWRRSETPPKEDEQNHRNAAINQMENGAMPAATTILDRAYALHKQGTDAHRVQSLATLAAEFPKAGRTEIEAALDRAGVLIDASCEWAEQRRGPLNDGNGTPSVNLQERCPGFSGATYSDVEAWGLYLTK
jgi:hypothetical protein